MPRHRVSGSSNSFYKAMGISRSINEFGSCESLGADSWELLGAATSGADDWQLPGCFEGRLTCWYMISRTDSWLFVGDTDDVMGLGSDEVGIWYHVTNWELWNLNDWLFYCTTSYRIYAQRSIRTPNFKYPDLHSIIYILKYRLFFP